MHGKNIPAMPSLIISCCQSNLGHLCTTVVLLLSIKKGYQQQNFLLLQKASQQYFQPEHPIAGCTRVRLWNGPRRNRTGLPNFVLSLDTNVDRELILKVRNYLKLPQFDKQVIAMLTLEFMGQAIERKSSKDPSEITR